MGLASPKGGKLSHQTMPTTAKNPKAQPVKGKKSGGRLK